jgi:hypothetical protein
MFKLGRHEALKFAEAIIPIRGESIDKAHITQWK